MVIKQNMIQALRELAVRKLDQSSSHEGVRDYSAWGDDQLIEYCFSCARELGGPHQNFAKGILDLMIIGDKEFLIDVLSLLNSADVGRRDRDNQPGDIHEGLSEEIMKLIKTSPNGSFDADLIEGLLEEVGISVSSTKVISNQLALLQKSGEIVRWRRGSYRLASGTMMRSES